MMAANTNPPARAPRKPITVWWEIQTLAGPGGKIAVRTGCVCKDEELFTDGASLLNWLAEHHRCPDGD